MLIPKDVFFSIAYPQIFQSYALPQGGVIKIPLSAVIDAKGKITTTYGWSIDARFRSNAEAAQTASNLNRDGIPTIRHGTYVVAFSYTEEESRMTA